MMHFKCQAQQLPRSGGDSEVHGQHKEKTASAWIQMVHECTQGREG
jgi:hypothetical protein